MKPTSFRRPRPLAFIPLLELLEDRVAFSSSYQQTAVPMPPAMIPAETSSPTITPPDGSGTNAGMTGNTINASYATGTNETANHSRNLSTGSTGNRTGSTVGSTTKSPPQTDGGTIGDPTTGTGTESIGNGGQSTGQGGDGSMAGQSGSDSSTGMGDGTDTSGSGATGGGGGMDGDMSGYGGGGGGAGESTSAGSNQGSNASLSGNSTGNGMHGGSSTAATGTNKGATSSLGTGNHKGGGGAGNTMSASDGGGTKDSGSSNRSGGFTSNPIQAHEMGSGMIRTIVLSTKDDHSSSNDTSGTQGTTSSTNAEGGAMVMTTGSTTSVTPVAVSVVQTYSATVVGTLMSRPASGRTSDAAASPTFSVAGSGLPKTAETTTSPAVPLFVRTDASAPIGKGIVEEGGHGNGGRPTVAPTIAPKADAGQAGPSSGSGEVRLVLARVALSPDEPVVAVESLTGSEGSGAVADVPEALPPTQASDVLVAFTPFDPQSVDQAVRQFLSRFGDWAGPSEDLAGDTVPAVAWAVAVAVTGLLYEVNRRHHLRQMAVIRSAFTR